MDVKKVAWAGVVLALVALVVAAIGLSLPAPVGPAGPGMPGVPLATATATAAPGARYGQFDSVRIEHDLRANTAAFAGAVQFDGSVLATNDAEFDGSFSVDGAADFDSTVDVGGNLSSGVGAITVTDNIFVDGAADAVQLTVQGYTTQTNALLVLEQSDGTDKFTVSNAGNADVAGTLQYGGDDLIPLGFDGATTYEVYFGSASSVTNTTVASDTHNMTTAVDWAMCYVSDPDDDAGDPFLCVPTISGTSVTFQALQDDGENATTAATKLYYYIIGR